MTSFTRTPAKAADLASAFCKAESTPIMRMGYLTMLLITLDDEYRSEGLDLMHGLIDDKTFEVISDTIKNLGPYPNSLDQDIDLACLLPDAFARIGASNSQQEFNHNFLLSSASVLAISDIMGVNDDRYPHYEVLWHQLIDSESVEPSAVYPAMIGHIKQVMAEQEADTEHRPPLFYKAYLGFVRVLGLTGIIEEDEAEALLTKPENEQSFGF